MDEMQNPSNPAHQSDSKPDLNLGIELQDDLQDPDLKGDTLREERANRMLSQRRRAAQKQSP